MTADEIMRCAAGDGVALTVTPAGTIKARGPNEAVRRWLDPVRAHKAELLALLADREFFEERAAILEFDAGLPRPEAEACALEEWRVKLSNGAEARLIQQPGVTLAELRARYPGIVEAWPETVPPLNGCMR
jgi:hypothetical protein